MKYRILILGSSGFIGNHFHTFLSQKGHDIYCCDIFTSYTSEKIHKYKDVKGFNQFVSMVQFDFCINAAGNGNVQLSVSKPQIDYELNVEFVRIALEAIRLNQKRCRFIHLSSAAVYGNPSFKPILENSDLKPISPYGFHKVISEKICEQYAVLYGVQATVLRLFSVYGSGLKKQIIWDVHKKFSNLEKNDIISFFGTGDETRDFIYIEDLCNLIELILLNKQFCVYEIMNVANGEEVAIKSIIKHISTFYNSARYIFSGIKRQGDPVNWKADISKISKLGYKRQISFQQGLTAYTKWYQEHDFDE